jgi:hypothetical protein
VESRFALPQPIITNILCPSQTTLDNFPTIFNPGRFPIVMAVFQSNRKALTTVCLPQAINLPGRKSYAQPRLNGRDHETIVRPCGTLAALPRTNGHQKTIFC